MPVVHVEHVMPHIFTLCEDALYFGTLNVKRAECCYVQSNRALTLKRLVVLLE